MEGYGRWIALIIFSIWFSIGLYADYKKDKWGLIYPTLIILGVSLIDFLLIMIVKFW